MSCDHKTFESAAEATLAGFLGAIEAAGADLEVDLEGGILTIELDDGGTFVLNRHGPLRQLWLSSPVSGASHYELDAADGRWKSTRGGGDLAQSLAADLSRLTGTSIALG